MIDANNTELLPVWVEKLHNMLEEVNMKEAAKPPVKSNEISVTD